MAGGSPLIRENPPRNLRSSASSGMGETSPDMNEPIEFKYQPIRCALLNKQVWAILTKQPNGSWRIVNCLDKDEACFGLNCAFTTDDGDWPYPTPAAEELHRQ